LKFFSPFRIFQQLALALKTEFARKFFSALDIPFTLRIFEQLALALKTEFSLKFLKPGEGCRHPPRTPMPTPNIKWESSTAVLSTGCVPA